MAKQNKQKPIHLISIRYDCKCRAVCDMCLGVGPIETIFCLGLRNDYPKGTFDPKKVTCKRCLKHPGYKEAMEKIKYPLFHWRERCDRR